MQNKGCVLAEHASLPFQIALPVDAETLERPYRARSSMPSVEVVYSALGPVRSVQGDTLSSDPDPMSPSGPGRT
jgi:hypothetical protein